MSKKKRPLPQPRLDPETRICPQFDSAGIKLFLAPSEKMGVRVVDNAAEDHEM